MIEFSPWNDVVIPKYHLIAWCLLQSINESSATLHTPPALSSSAWYCGQTFQEDHAFFIITYHFPVHQLLGKRMRWALIYKGRCFYNLCNYQQNVSHQKKKKCMASDSIWNFCNWIILLDNFFTRSDVAWGVLKSFY